MTSVDFCKRFCDRSNDNLAIELISTMGSFQKRHFFFWGGGGISLRQNIFVEVFEMSLLE